MSVSLIYNFKAYPLMDNQAEVLYAPFHLAIPTHNLQLSKQFYGQILGCQQGRTDPQRWIDYNFFGSQLVAHFASSEYSPKTHYVNAIPVPNFGVYVSGKDYDDTISKLSSRNVKFTVLPPQSQTVSQVLYVQDPTGNNILLHKRK